uniref:UBZ4-type domain-containing protein n=1 Tax=Lotharella oceanica TaxID=641309 RepID=A0A7S2XEX6_9EUKA
MADEDGDVLTFPESPDPDAAPTEDDSASDFESAKGMSNKRAKHEDSPPPSPEVATRFTKPNAGDSKADIKSTSKKSGAPETKAKGATASSSLSLLKKKPTPSKETPSSSSSSSAKTKSPFQENRNRITKYFEGEDGGRVDGVAGDRKKGGDTADNSDGRKMVRSRFYRRLCKCPPYTSSLVVRRNPETSLLSHLESILQNIDFPPDEGGEGYSRDDHHSSKEIPKKNNNIDDIDDIDSIPPGYESPTLDILDSPEFPPQRDTKSMARPHDNEVCPSSPDKDKPSSSSSSRLKNQQRQSFSRSTFTVTRKKKTSINKDQEWKRASDAYAEEEADSKDGDGAAAAAASRGGGSSGGGGGSKENQQSGVSSGKRELMNIEEKDEKKTEEPAEEMGTCFICQKKLPMAKLNAHVNRCLDQPAEDASLELARKLQEEEDSSSRRKAKKPRTGRGKGGRGRRGRGGSKQPAKPKPKRRVVEDSSDEMEGDAIDNNDDSEDPLPPSEEKEEYEASQEF